MIMDILKRSLAPITDEGWNELESNVKRALLTHLSARRVVDVVGPKGWDFAAVDLGRLEVAKSQEERGVRYGIRKVLPLIESRIRFKLDIWELDNVSRGAKDADLDAALDAARQIAAFEDDAILNGFKPGGVSGLLKESPHAPVPLELDASGYLDAVSRAMIALQDAGVEGPYALVAGPEAFRALASAAPEYPLTRQVERLIEGRIVYSRVVDGAALVSTRGGDLELTLGQDLCIGYHSHDTESVWLYLTESFTFRVLDPSIVVRLESR
jgi:uncharacterized linocin/CFP29 family protein